MATIESKISTLVKQNDSIYSSLIAKGIQFERINLNDIEEIEHKLQTLMVENEKLKTIAKDNKPVSKPVPKPVVQVQSIKKDIKPDKQESDEEVDEVFDDTKAKFSTLTNMEDLKRSFCSGDYETFDSLTKAHPFKYFNATYKYSSDKDGCQDFIAKNLLKGFVKNMEDLRKYFFVCFRCNQVDPTKKTYSYTSMWIFNSNHDLKTVLGDMFDDFDFIQTDMSSFLVQFRKSKSDDCTNLLDEIYLH
jgi:uncharacterized phage infection (PIP) family protein YhgE